MISRLPLLGLLERATLVLPFTATFAALTWWSGNPISALALLEKSFLSGFAAAASGRHYSASKIGRSARLARRAAYITAG